MTSESLPAAAMVLAQGLWLELVSRRREPAGDESADDDHAQTDAVRDEHGDGVVGDEVQEPGDRRKRHDQRDERSDDGRAPRDLRGAAVLASNRVRPDQSEYPSESAVADGILERIVREVDDVTRRGR